MDLHSVADSRRKAERYKGSQFYAKSNKLAKQAILRELNQSLMVTRTKLLTKGVSTRDDVKDEKRRGATQPDVHKRMKSGNFAIPKPTRIPRLVSLNEQGASYRRKLPTQGNYSSGVSYYQNEKQGINAVPMSFLAQKYADLWLKAVYGRVKPSVARDLYEKNLLKTSMKIWMDIWWSSRRGWKLQIRADYHNRYRQWQRTFRAWRVYIGISKEKKKKKALAVDFAVKTSLSKSWKYWKSYVFQRRKRIMLKEIAEETRNNSLLRTFFSLWLTQSYNQRLDKALEYQALKFWSSTLKMKILERWKNALVILREEQAISSSASGFAEHKLKNKCFQLLMSYAKVRKLKEQQKEFATLVYTSQLKKKALRYWHNQLQRRYYHRDIDEQVSCLQSKHRSRRCFEAWIRYVAIRQKEREYDDMAHLQHNRRVKRKVLTQLRMAVSLRHTKDEMVRQANAFHGRKRLELSWVVWLKKCEESEELNMFPLTRIARLHHKTKLCRKAFQGFCRYLDAKKQQRVKFELAEKHFTSVNLPKYFVGWIEFSSLSKERKWKAGQALEFRREVLLTKHWFYWQRRLRRKEETFRMKNLAKYHHETSLKWSYLQIWRLRTLNYIDVNEKMLRASNHHEETLLRRYFQQLYEHARTNRKRWQRESAAIRFERRKYLSKAFVAWKTYRESKLHCKQKEQMAGHHFHRRQLTLVFHAWREMVLSRKVIYINIEERYHVRCRKILRAALLVWKGRVEEMIAKREKQRKAEFWLGYSLSKKVFGKWKMYAILHGEHQRQQREQLEEYQLILAQGIKRRLFFAWKDAANTRSSQRVLDLNADKHFNQTLKRKAVTSWKAFMALQFRHKILERQSFVFFTQSVTCRWFQKWKREIENKQLERKRCSIALWWWSVSLQRKVLYAWLDFSDQRRKIKQQTTLALEFRRNYFTKTAIKRWFLYSNSQIQFRSSIASRRNAELSASLHQLVHKFAMRWYYKTKRNMKVKGETPDREQVNCTNALGLDALSVTAPKSTDFTRLLSENLPRRQTRPPPRLPTYLRDSFDLDLLTTSEVDQTGQTDDTCPRVNLPMPLVRERIHPPLDTSALVLTSDGEDTSTLPGLQHGAVAPTRKHLTQQLIPPAFFERKASTSPEEKTLAGAVPKARNIEEQLMIKNVSLPARSNITAIQKAEELSVDQMPVKFEKTADLYHSIKTLNDELRGLGEALHDCRQLKEKIREMNKDKGQREGEEIIQSRDLKSLQDELEKKSKEIAKRKAELAARSVHLESHIRATYHVNNQTHSPNNWIFTFHVAPTS